MSRTCLPAFFRWGLFAAIALSVVPFAEAQNRALPLRRDAPRGRDLRREDRTNPYQRRYTIEDFNRWAQQAAIKRLTPAQLDPETGLLAWPRKLLDGEYADVRRELDRLFVARAQLNGAISNEMYDAILDRVDAMTYRLTETVTRVRGPRRTHDYINARNFLLSMARETGYESLNFDDTTAE